MQFPFLKVIFKYFKAIVKEVERPPLTGLGILKNEILKSAWVRHPDSLLRHLWPMPSQLSMGRSNSQGPVPTISIIPYIIRWGIPKIWSVDPIDPLPELQTGSMPRLALHPLYELGPHRKPQIFLADRSCEQILNPPGLNFVPRTKDNVFFGK